MGTTLSSELLTEPVSRSDTLWAVAAPPKGHLGGRITCLLILTLPTSV